MGSGHILTAGADLNLRDLADIARDRSVAGRAKLFALLAALLTSRWQVLTLGERVQLAELVALLWPRGDSTDRQQLCADLADKMDIPPALRQLMPAAPVNPSAMASSVPSEAMPGEVMAKPSSTGTPKSKISIVTQSTVVVRRKAPVPSSSAGPAGLPTPRISSTDQIPSAMPDGIPAQEKPAEIAAQSSAEPAAGHSGIDVSAPLPISAMPSPAAPGHAPVAADAPAPSSPAAADTVTGSAGSNPAGVDSGLALAQSTIINDAILASDEPTTPADPPAAAASIQGMEAPISIAPTPLVGAPIAPVVPAPVIAPPAPRENPHRLTAELLADVLKEGDLARFEVMLAHLSGLRTSLLRRLLRDGGGEGLAILARAAGIDDAGFRTQLQDWRRRQQELGRFTLLSETRDSKRIGDFFAALTEQQVERLIHRWRSTDNRLFAKAHVDQLN